MKHPAQILLLALCASLSTLGATQVEVKAVAQITDFEIEPSKPYVYLEVDHVGPRKPLRYGEPNLGIYLRLKNNCRLPIVIVALEGRPSDSIAATSIEDEVVPDPQGLGGDGAGGGAYVPSGVPGVREMDDILRSPNTNETEVRGAELAERNALRGSRDGPDRPYGYNSANPPDFRMLTLIPPGGQVFFSVPANHVSKTWHIEIPFRFALKRQGPIRQPYSYVAFYHDDLPNDQKTATSTGTEAETPSH